MSECHVFLVPSQRVSVCRFAEYSLSRVRCSPLLLFQGCCCDIAVLISVFVFVVVVVVVVVFLVFLAVGLGGD